MLETKVKNEVENNKQDYVHKMFSGIAKQYDLLNNLMTLGMHNSWKKKAIKLSLNEIEAPHTALDLCSGTGDLGLMIKQLSPNTKVLCVDNCKNMLSIAQDKINKLNLNNISTEISNVENLQFDNNSYNMVSIGYGLRNLVEKEKCLSEIYRILSPGGVFMCIDLGHPTNNFWGLIFNTLFFNVIPFLGKIFAKNEEAYTYLPLSLKSWYTQSELKDLILKTGFKKCFYKNVFGGATAIHIAVK